MDNYANFNGSFGSRYHAHCQTWLNGQDTWGNHSSIHIRIYLRVDAGYSWSGLSYFNTQARLNYNNVATGGFPGSGAGYGTWIAIDWDGNVGHDVNGNCHVVAGVTAQASWGGIGSAGGDWGWNLPRIPLGPQFTSLIADNIKPTTARLGVEISSHGHGTSTGFTMYYRQQGSSNWIDLGHQGDAAGYNYWNVSGLKPGKVYEYHCNAWNNNGDFSQIGVYSFKTKPVAGLTPILMRLA
jgi:hypothetical protein